MDFSTVGAGQVYNSNFSFPHMISNLKVERQTIF